MNAAGTNNTDQVTAYCGANGLIEITKRSVPAGMIWIVKGERKAVRDELTAAARHGKGGWAGKLIVPGVPEAADEDEGIDALKKFIGWRSRRTLPGLSWNTRGV